MRVSAFLLSTTAAATMLASCSGSSSGVSSISGDTACSDYASAVCAKIDGCGATLTVSVWGDVAACTTRFKSSCTATLAASSASVTPERIDTCSKAVTAAGCDALFDRNLPADCRSMPGALPNGTACGDDNQCTSAYCNKGLDSVCGTCGTARSKSGDACAIDENCDYGLKCANKKCVAPAPAGGACDADHPCAGTLVCDGTTCAKPVADGAACKPGKTSTCDPLGGEFCSPKMMVCKKLKSAMPGQTCGYDAMADDFIFCAASGSCKIGTGMGILTGTCVAAAADGALCDTSKGPSCMDGAKCVNGVCRRDDPSSCK